MADYTGGCQCGKVRYRIDGEPRNPSFCHCASCRRSCGASPVPWATFDRDRFVLERGELAEFQSSPPVSRGFCSTCGTTLTYAHSGRPREVDVTIATLDEPGRVPPLTHIWVRDKLPWIDIDDGRPQFKTVEG